MKLLAVGAGRKQCHRRPLGPCTGGPVRLGAPSEAEWKEGPWPLQGRPVRLPQAQTQGQHSELPHLPGPIQPPSSGSRPSVSRLHRPGLCPGRHLEPGLPWALGAGRPHGRSRENTPQTGRGRVTALERGLSVSWDCIIWGLGGTRGLFKVTSQRPRRALRACAGSTPDSLCPRSSRLCLFSSPARSQARPTGSVAVWAPAGRAPTPTSCPSLPVIWGAGGWFPGSA